MYAVVKTGGKQVKLETGMTEVVEKIDTPVGGTVTFTPLFVSDDGKAMVGGDVAGVTVTAEVVEHFKDDKVVVFKFKKRKGYKKTRGHRQLKTRIRVTDIALEGGAAPKKAAAKKPAKAKTEAVEAEAAVVETPVEAPVEKPKRAAKPKAPKTEKAAAPAADEAAEKPKRTRKPAAKKEETPAEPSAE